MIFIIAGVVVQREMLKAFYTKEKQDGKVE